MATAKEASSASYIEQVSEALRVEQNSFLGFIDQNKDLFERHSSLTYELRDEEQGWRNSSTLDYFAEKNIELVFLLHPQVDSPSSKTMRKVRETIRVSVAKVVFGNLSEKDRLAKSFLLPHFPSKSRDTPQSNALTKVLEESLDDFQKNYHEAKAPLVSGIRESKAELMGRFEDFLLSNPSNIFAFEDFLLDKKNHAMEIEKIRPFLSSLADSEQSLTRDKKEGILRRVVKKWINELKEKPNPATVDKFAASIKSPNVLEWLKFAAQGEDIANFLRSRPDVSTWTTELKEALFSFVSSRYLSMLSSIEKDLEQYRKPLALKSISQRLNPKLEAEIIEKVTVKIPEEKSQDDNKRIVEKAEEEKYPVGMLSKGVGRPNSIRPLEKDELEIILEKEAAHLDSSDPRMLEDLKKIIIDLCESPYGLGVKKLTDKFVGVGNRRLPLRSINPGKRIGLSLDHPESTKIRIVYVIYRNEESPVIGIEGIYNHNDYDKKFVS